jgi:hypothetical protein
MRKTDREAVVIRGRVSEGCLVALRLGMQRMTGEDEIPHVGQGWLQRDTPWLPGTGLTKDLVTQQTGSE